MAKKPTKKPTKKTAAKVVTPEEQALKDAKAATRKAQQAADKAKKDKIRENNKKKAEAAAKGAKAAALRVLDKTAKEVNVRFDKAAQLDGKADDHRLAAALLIAEAEAKCKKDGIKFKEWAADNITQSYETVRKLLPIGQSDNPALALEDMRNKNKKVMKKLRDKKAAEKSEPQGKTGPKKEPFVEAEQVLLRLDESVREAVLTSVADYDGMSLMPKTEVKSLRKSAEAAAKSVPVSTLDAAIAAFDGLKAKDKMAMLRHAAIVTGMIVSNPADAEDYDPLTVPEGLKRTK